MKTTVLGCRSFPSVFLGDLWDAQGTMDPPGPLHRSLVLTAAAAVRHAARQRSLGDNGNGQRVQRNTPSRMVRAGSPALLQRGQQLAVPQQSYGPLDLMDRHLAARQ
ncbi:hypothetical protein [Streptomyces sp. WM6378]|uniref:hypothetical protein n=1 Tax=Streptomyces sp. WM6378 TaxID=1415557 RepID=UPI00131C5A72|nr:hypothetical protein [Streptomyces sp. WM6378]